MTAEVRKQLEQLRTKTQSDSLAEVVRRALTVFDYLWTMQEKGATITVKDEKGTRELVIT